MKYIELSNYLDAELIASFTKTLTEKSSCYIAKANAFEFLLQTVCRDDTLILSLCSTKGDDIQKEDFVATMSPLLETLFDQMSSKYFQLTLEYALKIKSSDVEKPYTYVFTEHKFNNDFTMDKFLQTECSEESILSVLGLKATFT